MGNIFNRNVPDYIEGYGDVKHFAGAYATKGCETRVSTKTRTVWPGEEKVLPSIKDALIKGGFKDGMTVSFHHHFRNGDTVLNMVMKAIDEMGFKNIKVAASGIFPCHEPLVDMIERGVVTAIEANYINGPVAKAVSKGKLKTPAVLRTHGGRDRAIISGDLHIDFAFIAASACDRFGNMNGIDGKAPCGALGYPVSDAMYADVVVAVTDSLSDAPLTYVSIGQQYVDYIVEVECSGDTSGIATGIINISSDPINLRIARYAAETIKAAGFIKDGFSFQTGGGKTSLAVTQFIKKFMEDEGVKASFILGGISKSQVDMLREGLVTTLYDTQSFDLAAIKSVKEDYAHVEISSSTYANPHIKAPVVNFLDVMLLGATEMDTKFNANVVSTSEGMIMGGSGGHSDAAAGSKMAIVVTNLIRRRFPIITDEVVTITTPGETIDVVVTEYGISLNDKYKYLEEPLKALGLPVMTIEEQKNIAYGITGAPGPYKCGDRIVAVVEYRDGTVIDVVRQAL